MKIVKEIEIEDLVNLLPESVAFLMNKNIRCLRCGEPVWGTFESAAKEKGYSDSEINNFVLELNGIMKSTQK